MNDTKSYVKIKILVIEDDEDLKDLVADSLKKNYWHVLTAPDGSDGLAKAQNEKFDFIICDIQMPKMRGDATIKALKAHSENIDTPVVVVSGTLDPAVVSNIRGMVTRAFIKPFNMEDLCVYIAKYLEAKKAKAAA